VKVINCILAVGASFEDIFCAAREDEDADGKEDSHYCPEKTHKDDATSILEDSREDQITVEG
jgi:hypothetical protein